MIVSKGEKLHVINRRLFEGDLRRHFAGEVEEVSREMVLLSGYAFIFEPSTNSYVRLPERRRRIIGLASANLVINLLPDDVKIDQLVYRINQENRLIVTDGSSFSLDINEFGVRR